MTMPTLRTGDAIEAGGRIIPIDRLVGVAQIADLFNRLRDQMTLPEGSPRSIKRSHVSNWVNRRDKTGFPEPLPITAFQGASVWDLHDFVTDDDGPERLLWTGPPGRWPRQRVEQ